MSTKGNFTRKHYLAAYVVGSNTPPKEADFFRLANRIKTITDDSSDETDSAVFYDTEDGSAEESLLGRTEVWTFAGEYDPEDPAHMIVSKARRSDDDGRKMWHKVEETDGSVVVGLAKLFDPKAGGGDATAKEVLSGRIAFIKKPEVTPVAPPSGE